MDVAKIQIINDIKPIEGADKIEVASILGYTSVVKKGEYQVGDIVIFVYPDTKVPKKSWSEFLFKGDKESKEYVVLKKIRLRGVLSEGLALPISLLSKNYDVGADISEELELEHYEKPIPVQLSGQIEGHFPSFIPKTDSLRLESYPALLQEIGNRANGKIYIPYYGEIKHDGSSYTAYYRDGKFGVCSRNYELKESSDNSFWQVIRKYDIQKKLKNFCKAHLKSLAIQMELVGIGVQKNSEDYKELTVRIFDFYDIDKKEYFNLEEKRSALHLMDLTHLAALIIQTDINFESINEYKDFVNKQVYTTNGTPVEGIVFKPHIERRSDVLGGRGIFKVINDNYKE